MTTDLDLSDLTSDLDTIELEDGRTIRLRIESDPDTSVNDYDCYGRVAWVKHRPWGEHDQPRPAGFTGRAMKLETYSGDAFWWEPCEDSPDPRAEISMMRDLITYGFHGLILELLDGTDAYGHPIVVETASLWGVDNLDAENVRFIVADLASELSL